MAEIRLENIVKDYTDRKTGERVRAVDRVFMTCRDREFLVMLGPSGCGKTSTLRMVAGLEEVSSGEIFIGERPVSELPPQERNIGMAFENYALYPPLSIGENLSFPLKAAGLSRGEIAKRLEKVTGILGLGDVLHRRTSELSGGQQQRVSLGRCIIRDADVYLMDEPLSHLDLDLRLRTRGELKRIHELMHRTIMYVTHDQNEAMAMADRVAVMNDGIIHQCGSQEDIFERPADLFVAGFIGEPPMNLLEGKITRRNGENCFAVEKTNICIPLPGNIPGSSALPGHNRLYLGIRPHYIHMEPRDDFCEIPGNVEMYESLGESGTLEINAGGANLTLVTRPDLHFRQDEPVNVFIDPEKLHLFDQVTGKRIQV